MFYGPIAREENRNLPEPLNPKKHALDDVFIISTQEWPRVLRMDISETNPNNKDLFMFVRKNK